MTEPNWMGKKEKTAVGKVELSILQRMHSAVQEDEARESSR